MTVVRRMVWSTLVAMGIASVSAAGDVAVAGPLAPPTVARFHDIRTRLEAIGKEMGQTEGEDSIKASFASDTKFRDCFRETYDVVSGVDDQSYWLENIVWLSSKMVDQRDQGTVNHTLLTELEISAGKVGFLAMQKNFLKEPKRFCPDNAYIVSHVSQVSSLIDELSAQIQITKTDIQGMH